MRLTKMNCRLAQQEHQIIFNLDIFDIFNDSKFVDTVEDEPENRFNDKPQEQWKSLVVCINDTLSNHNPLIGRQEELDRTIQVLCRHDKNTPLHVGEPGVGKTALIYGLAQRIKDGNVPKRLKGARIYQLELGTLVAGTQYRGEFEERMNEVLDGLQKEKNAILYIDEIHTLIGAGGVEGSTLDGSNILKHYLVACDIRFIGATIYKEYSSYKEKSQGLIRRFQKNRDLRTDARRGCAYIKGCQTYIRTVS